MADSQNSEQSSTRTSSQISQLAGINRLRRSRRRVTRLAHRRRYSQQIQLPLDRANRELRVVIERLPETFQRPDVNSTAQLRVNLVRLSQVVNVQMQPPVSGQPGPLPDANALPLATLEQESERDTLPAQADAVPRAPVDRPVYGEGRIARKRTHRKALQLTPQQIDDLCNSPHNLGGMSERCQFCGAKFFKDEFPRQSGTFRICCNRGILTSIPTSLPIPDQIKSLYVDNGRIPQQFRENIRYINGLFAMASFKTSAPIPDNQITGPCFAINGQIYHYFNAVPNTQDLRNPRLNHYYFLDVQDSIERRAAYIANAGVGRQLIEIIERSLRAVNPFMQSYKTMSEQLNEIRQSRQVLGEPVDDVYIGFHRNMNRQLQNANLPASKSEIAALFVGNEPPFDVDLLLFPKAQNRTHVIKNLNDMADPMVYPLLFPGGDPGRNILTSKGTDGKTVTARQFYRYKIQIRDEFSAILSGQKLFQQYLVDAWVKAESDTLRYIRDNNGKFRIAQEDVLRRFRERMQAISVTGDIVRGDEAEKVGRPVILPTSFTGGERNMERRYQDSMAVVARFGKPDLIITMTCNPQWREIKDNLGPNQTWQNRPDLVCRVFHAKMKALKKEIVQDQVLGIVSVYDYVIEFQKRGLPHMHMVVTFINDDKIRTIEDVDNIVNATIPDYQQQPLYHERVSRQMIHDSCSRDPVNATCINRHGRCRFRYPIPYADITVLRAGNDANARPIYRRPNDGRIAVTRDGRNYDNQYVSPYNPYFLAKYNAHINFEVVASSRAVKYLYKYLHKGLDHLEIEIDCQNQLDEIQRYEDCRYVSATEAAWRLYEFKLHERSHSVVLLHVHLPGLREVAYEGDDEDAINAALNKPSKLEAFFTLNASNPHATEYLYREIPEHFTWNSKEGRWDPRVRSSSKCIGSIYQVPASEIDAEKYYLRVLLLNVRGPKSFEDLRTVNGELCPNFRTACIRRNLLTEALHYRNCMEEAVIRQSPGRLRRLFTTICAVSHNNLFENGVGHLNYKELWHTFKGHLMEDYLRQGSTYQRALTLLINAVNTILNRCKAGLTLEALNIELEDDDIEQIVGEGGQVPQTLPYGDVNLEHQDLDDDDLGNEDVEQIVYDINRLNKEQKHAFASIINAVRYLIRDNDPLPDYVVKALEAEIRDDIIFPRNPIPKSNVFYVDGPGGTGKTYLYNTILTYIQRQYGYNKIISCAWTGIAANLLIQGRTVHGTFKLPINVGPQTTCGFYQEDRRSQIIKNAAIIMWDEAPMSNRLAVEAIDRYIRDLMDNKEIPFGGKCVVFGGDFRQILPVVKVAGDGRAYTVDACIQRSAFWSNITQLRLSENMRAHAARLRLQNNPRAINQENAFGSSFADWLIKLGEGKVSYVDFPVDRRLPRNLIEVPQQILADSVEQLVDFVFGDILDMNLQEIDGSRAILTPTNIDADIINNLIVEKLPGNSRHYFSVDTYNSGEGDQFQPQMEEINAIILPNLPRHELILKAGCIITLLRNIDVGAGQCNGTTLKVLTMHDQYLECEVLTGTSKGRVTLIPRVEMTGTDYNFPRPITRMQFPVRVAFALTINKSQGQTFEKVGVALTNPCFSHGQLYVALSRVGAPDNVRIFVNTNTRHGKLRPPSRKVYTSNVVYYEVFRNLERVGRVPPIDTVDDAYNLESDEFEWTTQCENLLNLPRQRRCDDFRSEAVSPVDDRFPLNNDDQQEVGQLQNVGHVDSDLRDIQSPPRRRRRREVPVRLLCTPPPRQGPPTYSDDSSDSGDDLPVTRNWEQYIPYYTNSQLAARQSRKDQAGTSSRPPRH